ncbi:fusion protein [Wufeng Chodsigoa smithii henipavirus 1]|nr:fusion protein [Wufeng Chodsigoa smithii henipavirus 1]
MSLKFRQSTNNRTNIRLILIIVLIKHMLCIHYENLSSVGIIKGNTYNYKIKGDPSTKMLVVKLIPNIDGLGNCTDKQMKDYKTLVKSTLQPVKDSLAQMLNNVETYNGYVKFFGAVMAGAALGVATAATVTAGIALHQSNQNAKDIANMKDAIMKTNQAITTLSSASQKMLTVIDSIRGEINQQIIPVLNQLSCETVGLNLGIKLTQYYSQISTFFGPALQNPVQSILTIQAISHAFGGNFNELMTVMGYTGSDFQDIIQGNLITGSVIGVDPEVGYIALEIRIPSLTVVPNAYVQELLPVSFNIDGDEWMTIVPNYVLTRTTYLSNIDINRCLITDKSVICGNDYATPMSNQLINCLNGNTQHCAREAVVTSYVPKFALSGGVIYANCLSTVCRCIDKDQPISQSLSQTLMMLDNQHCNVYQISNVLISTGRYLGDAEFRNEGIDLGPPIVVDKIDLGGQIADINQTISDAEEFIEESNKILSKINPKIISVKSMVVLYVVVALIAILAMVSLVLSIRLTMQVGTKINQFAYTKHVPSMENVQYIGTR